MADNSWQPKNPKKTQGKENENVIEHPNSLAERLRTFTAGEGCVTDNSRKLSVEFDTEATPASKLVTRLFLSIKPKDHSVHTALPPTASGNSKKENDKDNTSFTSMLSKIFP